MQRAGRYLLFAPIATGGMASVYLGRLDGSQGFRRPVAIKRMHVGFGRQLVIDEARLSSRVRHANVVQAVDVVEHENELLLVLEYVHGDSLDRLLAAGPVPPRIAAAIVSGALRGLHAAHEARAADGQPLELVHRDLSPHNILVDVAGVARVLDFGVARARGRLQATQDGQLKGKLAYLAPEQVHGDTSRRSDLFTAGAVLWECLTGRRLFEGTNEGDLLAKVLLCKVARVPAEAQALQPVLDHALDRDPARRFATAAEMADALDAAGAASAAEVAAWVQRLAGDRLAERAKLVEQLEHAPAAEPTPAAPRRSLPLVAAGVAVLGLTAGAAALWPRSAFVAAPVVVMTAPTPAPAPVVVAPPAPAPKAPAPKPAAVVKKTKAVDACEPPYTIDSAGVKRFKVECLR